jgi:hypothetical protein
MKVDHVGRLKAKGDWAIYADGNDALAWTPALEKDAHARFSKFVIGNKNARSEFELAGRVAIPMRSAATGDVWRKGTTIAVVDFRPKRKKATVEQMAERVLEVPGQVPKPAGTIRITSGCLAILAPAKKVTFTEAEIRKGTFESPHALLISLPNGNYDVTWDLLAKKSNWAPIYHEDEYATYGSRVLLTRAKRS